MFDPEMKKELIMEHYMHPLNKETIEDKDYIKVNTNSESCIDNIDLFVKIEDGIIKDIHFNGEACAISTSATSIMIKLLLGKTVSEARVIMENYNNMIEEKEYDPEVLGEANVYEDIHKQKNRIGCATISWRGFAKVLEEYEKQRLN